MRLCGNCSEPYRKGKLALVSTGRGLKSAMVCPRCVAFAALVVSAKPVARCKCGGVATACGACVSRVETAALARNMAGALKALKAMVRGAKIALVANMTPRELETNDGRIEGLEAAVALLESGRW
jgi:hypothetical protein